LALGLMPSLGFSNPDAPLPKVEEVVKRAVERGKLEPENDTNFKLHYYFVRSRITEIRNVEGKLKKTRTKISTNAPAAWLTAAPPEPAEPVVVINSSKQGEPAAPSSPQALPRKFDKNQLKLSDDLVERFDFKLVGREITNGCSALVLDFAPKKKKLPENGLRDRVVNRMAGRVWVDEREFAIRKATLRLTESLSIVGGIVGEARKFEYSFHRERTDDGLWYVTNSEWHLEGREVLVQRQADYRETRTLVRKETVPTRGQR
jgi:hypothetical protein